jgi:catechol 2,3-dioxygenase-like lactoylglutathione lyase family enzyme
VDDLERASRFYEERLGLRKLGADDRFCVFSVADRQVLLLFRRGATRQPTPTPGGMIPPHDGSGPLHLAFSIAASELKAWEKYLQAKGIVIESRVRWPRGGHSLYFRDPEQHLVELLTPGCWPIY